jgi:hypothetical protein
MFAPAFAAALVFAACGSSSTQASRDAAVDGVIPADADLGVDAIGCTSVPCLEYASSLVMFCAPSGTCAVQVTVSGDTTTTTKCFSNGVKIQLTAQNVDAGLTNAIMAVKKDDAACYSYAVMTGADARLGSFVYKDGAGADLLTYTSDGINSTYTCPGRSPIENLNCEGDFFVTEELETFTSEICPSGPCTF